MKEKKFWIIVNRNFPTRVSFKHGSYDNAEIEAKRLSRNNRRDEFVIMESIKSFKINEFVETKFVNNWVDSDCNEDIPF